MDEKDLEDKKFQATKIHMEKAKCIQANITLKY